MMDWNQLLSTARVDHQNGWIPQSSGDERGQWQRDHDRLIFSGAFRRLAVKTQVHPLSDNDHVHTRLSHSLEVASVGRSLGIRLGNWMRGEGLLSDQHAASSVGALVQAACLAHDIGNPPFGHAGERSIRRFFESYPEYLAGLSSGERADLVGFEGNAQGFRVITCLERHWFDGGMRLTAATLGAFVKYPFTADSAFGQSKRKHGVNQAELPLMRELAAHLGLLEVMPDVWARHPLVYAVEAADDICYALIDLEDAVELGHLDYEEVSSLMKELVDRGARRNLYEQLLDDSEAKLELLRSAAIDALVHEVEARFRFNYDAIVGGTFNEELLDWRLASAGEVIQRAKNLARERVYVDLTKQSHEGQSSHLLRGVLSHLIDGVEALAKAGGNGIYISSKARDAVARLGKFRPRLNDTKYARLMRVTDYVSAMTDRYLIRLVDDLTRLGYFDRDS
ncbi:MAG: deoxyguanosinetriphosphate triphosphohydrolase [Pseudomonadota bacterium]|nr:deoxyguanosinetriphosphate triphosphohydrolase [Pseudomonadota bacterium]MEE2820288.1 deoxyguanosinetriphosphate triphosphohydrolase [Pseudomonadota bacterium]